jgi:hypothetical protein
MAPGGTRGVGLALFVLVPWFTLKATEGGNAQSERE